MKYIGVFLLLMCLPFQVSAQNRYASHERAEAALGHYARARSMLIEALAEFEQGERLARPDMLLDTQEWRLSVISRAEELNRVLDPQPRVTRSGVRYKAGAIRIRHQSRQLPYPKEGPYQSSNVGERMLKVQKQQSKPLKTLPKEPVIVKKPKISGSVIRKQPEPVAKRPEPPKAPAPVKKIDENAEAQIEALIKQRLQELNETEQGGGF